MGKKMLQYIEEQPTIWRQTIKCLPAISISAKSFFRPQRIVFIGSGSSYYAAQFACVLLNNEESDCEFFASVPTRISQFKKHINTSVFVAVSQSGKSTSTEAIAKQLCLEGAKLWTITSNASSPLAGIGNGHILIPCNEEDVGPKTKGMSATVLTLYLLGKEICSGIGTAQLEVLNSAFEAFTQNRELCEIWARECTELCKNANSITVVADGAALPLAKEGSLKLLETLYIPVSTWEFEEYLHGVNNIIGPNMLHIFVINEESNRERVEKLISYCTLHGADCMVIDCGSSPCVQQMRLSLKCTGNSFTLPFELLIPFQVLSAITSQEKGINCDKPRYPDFYAALGTKLDANKVKA